MAAKTQETQELDYVGRIVSYELHYRHPVSGDTEKISVGCMPVRSSYTKGAPHDPIALLEYINKAAFDEAMKAPEFADRWQAQTGDFFVVITHQFLV